MAVNESPIGTYTDVTGVVNATAAAEVVALFVILKGYIPDPSDQADVPVHTDFWQMPPSVAENLRAEITALEAAIAAAPTA